MVYAGPVVKVRKLQTLTVFNLHFPLDLIHRDSLRYNYVPTSGSYRPCFTCFSAQKKGRLVLRQVFLSFVVVVYLFVLILIKRMRVFKIQS